MSQVCPACLATARKESVADPDVRASTLNEPLGAVVCLVPVAITPSGPRKVKSHCWPTTLESTSNSTSTPPSRSLALSSHRAEPVH